MGKKSCVRSNPNIKQITFCKETINELEESFDSLSDTLNLAGNNTRLKILYLLSQETDLCVCDLSDILGMSISAISQHLRKLKDRSIVNKRRSSQTIYYSLTEKYNIILMPFFELIKENKILLNK